MLLAGILGHMPEDHDTHQVTGLLGEIAEGKTSARDPLIEAVYDELRKIARVRMAAERPEHTLQATELVHQAFLKLSPNMGDREFRNHHEFYAAAAEAMRRILIDHARRRGAGKRGGGSVAIPIANVAELADNNDPEAVMAFNEAYELLAREQPDLGELVRLRFFAGLSVEETAKVLQVSEPTVKRRWRYARALLLDAMSGNEAVSDP